MSLNGLIPEILKAVSYNIDEETISKEKVDAEFKNEHLDEDDHEKLRFNFSIYNPKIMHTYRYHQVLKHFSTNSKS